MTDAHAHDRRYPSAAERLRAPERLALLEVALVVSRCLEGITSARILDVGTGTGVFAEAFAGQGLSVVGIDPNPEFLTVARGHAPGATFQAGIAEKLPFEDASFDLVFLGHVLHETDDPRAALTEARRVARRRVAVLEWPYRDENRGPPLGHRLQPAEIDVMARDAGFASIQRIDLTHMQLYILAAAELS